MDDPAVLLANLISISKTKEILQMNILCKKYKQEYTFERNGQGLLPKQTKHNQWLQEITNGPTNTTIMHKIFPTHDNAWLILQFCACHI